MEETIGINLVSTQKPEEPRVGLPMPYLFSRSTDFSPPWRGRVANFGVRVYVSIVRRGQ